MFETVKKFMLPVLAGLFLLILSCLPKVSPDTLIRAEKSARGLYLWESLEVLGNQENRSRFFRFCRQEKLDRVFCYISMRRGEAPYLVQYRDHYADFLNEAQRQGIQVYALAGEPTWLNASSRHYLRSILLSYRDFNQAQQLAKSPAFAGILLDIEPQTLPGWDFNKRDELARQYIALLQEARQLIPRDQLGATVADNYPTIRYNRENLAQAVSRECGFLAVMSYYRSQTLILENLRPFLTLPSDIYAGMETNLLRSYFFIIPESFYGCTRSTLNYQQLQIDARLLPYPRYQGIIIDDYTGFSRMRQ